MRKKYPLCCQKQIQSSRKKIIESRNTRIKLNEYRKVLYRLIYFLNNYVESDRATSKRICAKNTGKLRHENRSPPIRRRLYPPIRRRLYLKRWDSFEMTLLLLHEHASVHSFIHS